MKNVGRSFVLSNDVRGCLRFLDDRRMKDVAEACGRTDCGVLAENRHNYLVLDARVHGQRICLLYFVGDRTYAGHRLKTVIDRLERDAALVEHATYAFYEGHAHYYRDPRCVVLCNAVKYNLKVGMAALITEGETG